LDSFERSIKSMLGSPQMREWWSVQGSQFDEQFQDRVNRLLGQPDD